MIYGDILSQNTTLDILPFPKFPLGTDSSLMDNMSEIPKQTSVDDDFLNYIDKFQNNIQQVNLDPASVVNMTHE